MLLIYNFLSLIALIAYLPLLVLKKGPENKKEFLRERLGITHYEKADVWIHAVSVGEVLAALPFFRALRQEFPVIKIVLSTTTYTGQKIAREQCIGADRIMYMPWDSRFSTRHAVKYICPKIFITIETELWPALFSSLKKINSYVVILNGRISPESLRGYKIIKPFMKMVLSNIDFFYMQSHLDAERILSIGADKKNIEIMGNLKFDITLNNRETVKWLDDIKAQIMLVGSTHKGEEEIILDAFEKIKTYKPDLKLFLAPRHPERFNEVEEILKKQKFTYCRRSNLGTENIQKLNQADIVLVDTIGELSQLFARAKIAVIGGSLLPYGGHNILEPAYWSKPILFGPYMNNFPFADDFLKNRAALMVRNSRDIAETVQHLLRDEEKTKQMGQRAKEMVDRNAGAVKKALELVRNLLGDTERTV
jgi:3-deoxy-D-manno-octulosonic-acid transferase